MDGAAANTDEYLKDLPAWQITNLQSFRTLIHDVYPDITEEIKWGVPVFMAKGKTVFTMASFKAHTKYNFMLNGALLDDKKRLFNNGLESKKSRGIDLQEGQTADEHALRDLIEQSVSKL